MGAVDIKINHLGNRIAVSSLDYAISIYNVHPESGLTFYKDIQRSDISDLWKVDFNPNGNEIMSGALSLKTFDIFSGEIVNEFNTGSKYIHSLAYVRGFDTIKMNYRLPMGCYVHVEILMVLFRSLI
jgi:WD40 repeat protein